MKTKTQTTGVLSTAEAAERRGLLAKVHIAKKDLGLTAEEYEAILIGFKAGSSGELSIAQLERMVRYLKKLGWKPARPKRKPRPAGNQEAGVDTGASQYIAALRARCEDLAMATDSKSEPIGEKRLAGLTLKICGVSNLAWCRDAAKLKRLLAVLGKIRQREEEGQT